MSQTSIIKEVPPSKKTSTEKLSDEIDRALARLKGDKDKRLSEKDQVSEGIKRAKRGPKIETLGLQKRKASKLEELSEEQTGQIKDVFQLSETMAQQPLKKDLAFNDLVAQITSAQNTEVSASSSLISSSRIEELIQKIELTISYIQSKNLQHCKVTLKNPPGFEGVQLSVKIVGNKCNIEFLNLSEKTLALLEGKKTQLEHNLGEKVSSMQIESINFEKKAEIANSQNANQAFNEQQDEESEEGQGKQKKKKQPFS
jgi:hypothetical protein